MVESTRGIVERNGTGQSSIERRTYISSLPAKAALPGRTVGAHRGIENSMHGVLDVAFPEDGSQDPGWRDTSESRRLAPFDKFIKRKCSKKSGYLQPEGGERFARTRCNSTYARLSAIDWRPPGAVTEL